MMPAGLCGYDDGPASGKPSPSAGLELAANTSILIKINKSGVAGIVRRPAKLGLWSYPQLKKRAQHTLKGPFWG